MRPPITVGNATPGVVAMLSACRSNDNGANEEVAVATPRDKRPWWAAPLAWAVALAFAGWAAIRLGGLERDYPGVAAIAFTPYVALISPLGVIAALMLRQKRAAVVALAAAAALIAVVVPRTQADPAPDPAPTGPIVRVLAANLLEGSADPAVLEAVVRERDVGILSLEELTPEAASRFRSKTGLRPLLPYRYVDPLDGSAGTGLYSRWPLVRQEAPGDPAVGNELPTIRALAQVPAYGPIDLFSIHPTPPNSPESARTLGDYLDAIPAAEPDGAPRILAGDFNATLDDVELRRVIDTGYVDAADATGQGLVTTWPQRIFPPPVTIDHILVDEGIEILDYDVIDLPGSDHNAVYAELRLPSRAQLAADGRPK